MFRRTAMSAALWGALLFAGCKARSEAEAAPASSVAVQVTAKEPPARPTEKAGDTSPEAQQAQTDAHGSKWQDSDADGGPSAGGGFQMFKEAWVYVDGKPVGVIRETELPPIPEVWVDQVEDLDFKAGDPGPHERTYQVRRWRVSDYLAATGVDLKKVKAVFLHGGRGVVKIEGKWFRQYAKDLTFDLTGNDDLKLRVYIPSGLNPHINNTYDRYAAISVFIDKPTPEIDDDGNMVMGGTKLEGIPYYGQPLRGGIRVYLDGKLAMVVKRNSLGAEGKNADGSYGIAKLLEARHIATKDVAAIDVVDTQQIVTRLDTTIADLTFTSKSQAQGAITVSTGQDTNALLLWSKGHVAPVKQITPGARDKK